MRQRTDSRRSGSALAFSVLAVTVVSILAAAFMQLAMSVTRRLGSSSDTVQALNLAEAGLAEAYTGLAVAHTGNIGTAEEPATFGGGLLWVEATEHSGGMVELQCTAMYGTGRAVLGLACVPVSLGVASLGFFTKDDLRLNPDIRLDSYDSSKGTYASQINTSLNNQGSVGSNGDVSIASGNLIFGDVVYGPTGKAVIAAGAVVSGGTSARPEAEILPPVEVPVVPMKPSIKYSGAVPVVIPPGEVGYPLLEVGKDSKLVLKGPLTCVVGTLNLRLNAQMICDTTDGPITLVVTDSVDMSTSSLVSTTTQITSDTVVMVSAPAGKTVNFGAKSQFYGFIYAPDAKTHVSAKFEVYGGVVCKELQLAAQGRMHLDLGLGATVQAQLPVMESWRVVDLPQQLAAQRLDPFQVLGLDRRDLPQLSQAHEDQLLDLRYVATDGSTDSYFGLESEFDWSLVQEVLYGVRDGLAFFLPEDYADAGALGDDPLVSLVESSMTSKQLRDALLAATNVSSEALAAACLRNPPMAKSDLASVLNAQASLDPSVLLAAIHSTSLDSSALTGVLVRSSPLSPEVLAGVLTRNPPLAVSDLTNVLLKQ